MNFITIITDNIKNRKAITITEWATITKSITDIKKENSVVTDTEGKLLKQFPKLEALGPVCHKYKLPKML